MYLYSYNILNRSKQITKKKNKKKSNIFFYGEDDKADVVVSEKLDLFVHLFVRKWNHANMPVSLSADRSSYNLPVRQASAASVLLCPTETSAIYL